VKIRHFIASPQGRERPEKNTTKKACTEHCHENGVTQIAFQAVSGTEFRGVIEAGNNDRFEVSEADRDDVRVLIAGIMKGTSGVPFAAGESSVSYPTGHVASADLPSPAPAPGGEELDEWGEPITKAVVTPSEDPDDI
jgi:hypothetical protein